MSRKIMLNEHALNGFIDGIEIHPNGTTEYQELVKEANDRIKEDHSKRFSTYINASNYYSD